MPSFIRTLLLLLVLGSSTASAQTDADSSGYRSMHLDTVQVNAPAGIGLVRMVDNLLSPSGESWRTQQTAINLSDYLARMPGFSQITTGSNISKPVLHGMYGNRLLVLVNGLKYDAQQWQDEHGLGLSQIGIAKLDTYEQPESAEWGSEAIGGVISVEDEKADSGKRTADASIRLHSNTYGTLTDAGISDGMHRILWNVRAGYENNADYTDGNNTRVLNSRNKGYYLKSGFGFNRRHWKQYNYYNFSYNQFGFIIPDLSSFFQPDDPQSRSMSGPHHNVTLHFFNSRNEFRLKKSTLEVTAGVQSNRRAEDEGAGQISLDIHLLSLMEGAIWKKTLVPNTLRLELRQNLLYQVNTNYGPRILIPDAHVLEANGAAKIAYNKENSNFFAEAALGVNDRNIQTFLTKSLNAPGKEAQPFTINRPVVNGTFMAGLRDRKNDRYQFYYQFSTGSRSANLAELSSDGLHEGSYQYEIGNSDLTTEQSWCDKVRGILHTSHSHKVYLDADFSAYYNVFGNYIFLSPTTETRFGFPVFRYRQQNAGIGGIDVSYVVGTALPSHSSLQLQQSYSVVEGILSGGKNLPFIPPARLTSTLQYNLRGTQNMHVSDVFIAPQLQYNFPQDKPAPNELPAPDYALLHLNAGLTLNPYKKTTYAFTLGVRNLLNKAYADALSRIRYYGLNNQGLNVVLAVNIRHNW